LRISCETGISQRILRNAPLHRAAGDRPQDLAGSIARDEPEAVSAGAPEN
jgi:hypothetical protein